MHLQCSLSVHAELNITVVICFLTLCSGEAGKRKGQYAKAHPIQKRSRKDSESDPMRSCKREFTEDQRQNRRMHEKKRYTAMTEELRAMLRKKQNTPEALQQKKICCQKEKDALCSESISMENPVWVPLMDSPANQAHRAANFEVAWNDLDFFNHTWRALSIPPKLEQLPDLVNNDDNDMA
jgi:FtsZ-interacting cell division protein ZipA